MKVALHLQQFELLYKIKIEGLGRRAPRSPTQPAQGAFASLARVPSVLRSSLPHSTPPSRSRLGAASGCFSRLQKGNIYRGSGIDRRCSPVKSHLAVSGPGGPPGSRSGGPGRPPRRRSPSGTWPSLSLSLFLLLHLIRYHCYRCRCCRCL